VARQALTAAERASLPGVLDAASDQAAAAAGGFSEHHLGVARQTVRVRFAGPALVSHITRALAHLSVPPAPGPSLTIRVWDSHSTRVPAPVPDGVQHPVRGYIGSGGFFQWEGTSLSALDAQRGQGWDWGRNAESGIDRAAPLSAVFRSWLASREIQLVHAAAVGTEHGCVLLVGRGGAGKSSAVLACVAQGLRCVGDDACLLGPDNPPTVFSLYSSVQEEVRAIEPGGKTLAFLPTRALLHEAPLRAVAIVSTSGREDSLVRPASPGQALAALGPTSILRMPGPAQSTLARLARILEAVPCRHLEVGRGAYATARAVRSLL